MKRSLHSRNITGDNQGTVEPIHKSDRNIRSLTCHIGSNDGSLAWRYRKNADGTLTVYQSHLSVQRFYGMGDHMSQCNLLAGYKLLYDPLFLIFVQESFFPFPIRSAFRYKHAGKFP